MCDDCDGCSGCPEFVEISTDNLNSLAEALSRVEFSEPLENVVLTPELCREFLQPLLGQTFAFDIFEEMFGEFLFKKEVDTALWEMAQSGEISMSVDDDGQPTFFTNEDEEDEAEDSQS